MKKRNWLATGAHGVAIIIVFGALSLIGWKYPDFPTNHPWYMLMMIISCITFGVIWDLSILRYLEKKG